MTTATRQAMTGDEFLRLYGDRSEFEPVNGVLRETPMPGGIHGAVCIIAAAMSVNL